MKHLKLIALLLPLLLSTHLKADVINEHFYPDFAPQWTESTPATNAAGWSYLYAQRATNSKYVYYGNAAVSLESASWNSADAYLLTPVKTGGVGWINFRYKIHEVNATGTATFQLEIQTSEDGTDFTTEETVTVVQSDAAWKQFSKVAGKSNASYVRLVVEKGNVYGLVDIDELIITDAGSPSLDVAFIAPLESEVGVLSSIPDALSLSGANLTGDVNLSFESSSSPFAVTPAGVPAADVNTGKTLTVNFTPAAKYITNDFLKVATAGLPELLIAVSGTGMERNVSEDFNVYSDYNWQGFNYFGWEVSSFGNCSYVNNNNDNIFEGTGALSFDGSLISPKKIGGIGSISFMHKGYKGYAGTATGDFEVYVSADKTTWTKAGATTTTTDVFIPFVAVVNDAAAKYVKVAVINGGPQMVVDAFIITENGKTIASATGSAVVVETATTPYDFTVPVTFANITDNVTLSIDDAQLALEKSSLTPAEATGTVNLKVTFTPGAGKVFASGNITVSGGGLAFPIKVPVTAYLLSDRLFINFDGNWSDLSGNNIVEGWTLTNGYRATPGALGSPGAARIQSNSHLISPPKKNGAGAIQFLAKGSEWSTYRISVSTSVNGTDWTPVADAQNIALSGVYQAYVYNIGSSDAKYVRITADASSYGVDIDDVTVTPYGVGFPGVSVAQVPEFMVPDGGEQTLDIELSGSDISEDVIVSWKSGAAFSSTVTAIAKADLDGKTFRLPVTFKSGAKSFYADELILSGGGLTFDKPVKVKGYVLKDLIYQDFNGEWDTGITNCPMIDGWEGTFATKSTGIDAYEGGASFQLNPGNYDTTGDTKLLSVPKSGGVGVISFYYRNASTSSPTSFKVYTYDELNGTPTLIGDEVTLEPAADATAPYSHYTATVNSSTAKYIAIVSPKLSAGNYPGSVRIDAVAVTANGKLVPAVTAPASLTFAAFQGETATQVFNMSVEGVTRDVNVALANGSEYEVVQSTGEGNSQTITIIYTPATTYSIDTLWIESPELLKNVPVYLSGSIYQNSVVLDIESDESANISATSDTGSAVADGWFISGVRKTNSEYGDKPALQGNYSLRLNNAPENPSSITSPAIAGGVNKVAFEWVQANSYGALTIFVQTSPDRQTWTDADTLVTDNNPSYEGHHLYEKEIADPEAHYVRVLVQKRTAGYTSPYVWIDSIAVSTLPYVRQIGSTEGLSQSTATVPVSVSGWLDSNATVALVDGTNFSIATTSLTPEEVNNNAVKTFDLDILAATAGEFTDTVKIVLGDRVLAKLPVQINYTKPYIELAEIIDTVYAGGCIPNSTFEVKVTGLLNTDADITLKVGENFVLETITITPDDVAEGKRFIFNVNFHPVGVGLFTDTIVITNNEIETLQIPLSGIGLSDAINKVDANISVYIANGMLHVEGADAGTKVSVLNTGGQTLFTSTVKSAHERYPLALPGGVYIVKAGNRTWKTIR